MEGTVILGPGLGDARSARDWKSLILSREAPYILYFENKSQWRVSHDSTYLDR